MNRFKKFLNKQRIKNHFNNSGEGVRLSSGQPSSSQPTAVSGAAQGGQIDRVAAADIAAQAALKRMQKNEPQQDASKRRIQMIAKRELEEERRQLEGLQVSDQANSSTSSQPAEVEEKELEHSSLISGVYYTSELLGEDHVRSKADLLEDIKNFLTEQISDSEDDNDKVIAAVLMIYSLNTTAVKELAIDTIYTVVNNILSQPTIPKYRTIRLSNKTYNEKIAAAVGGRKFMEAIGFVEKSNGEEQCLIFSKPNDDHLPEALDALRNGQGVPIKVARNLELFMLKEGQKPKAPALSADFYNLSPAEIKAEQKNKTLQVDRMLTLRTKDMKKKDETVSNYRYKYTLIRVRLPGNLLMQGVFGCYEPFSAVRQFVASVLSDSLAVSEFTLRDATGQSVEDETTNLAQLSLAPAALLHLTFSDNITGPEGIVADEYVELIRELD
ncbi:CRE-UBXN-6 protein [Caenorhabditis remanei]|uniref:CRE-UBXN-6 protein n=1 Tax=Caenorhabditis remanei TaxID=31234 RepID=E3NIK4_CAERE|nr:CRE-UBXN-6 protein [Caenorhabditis remanei]